MYKLRDYQTEAVIKGLEIFNSTKIKKEIVVLPTGSGKSLIIASIAKELKGTTIIFQPSKEILEQNLQKMYDFGFTDVEVFSASMGKKNIGKITFATIGSIYNKKECWGYFDNILIDECFISGTKINVPNGYKNIEKLKIGDKVISAFGIDKVISVSKRTSKIIYKLKTSDGKETFVTPNHKIFTDKGWTFVKDLIVGDCWLHLKNDSNRNRWNKLLFFNSSSKRQKENRVTRKIRVESIEIQKQGSYEVYNIGVKNHPSYFVEDKLVHNCHLVNAKGGMYKEFIKVNGGSVMGLTATPYRLHSYNDMFTNEQVVVAKLLTRTSPKIFSKIIHVTQVKKLYEDKFLCPAEYIINDKYKHNEIKLNSTGRDFNENALKTYNKEKGVIDMVANTITENNSKHILVFNIFVSEAEELSCKLKQKGITAETVSAQTKKKDRDRILKDFKSGKIKVVTNVGVLTIGFDFPALDCIVLARPTQSVALFYQMVGRGTRINKGKPNVKVIDICGNVNRFGRIETFEIVYTGTNKLLRLRSEVGYLTGYDFVNNRDVEKSNYAGLKESEGWNKDIIRFGKYKGTHIKKIPTDYLQWCSENFKEGKYKDMFEKELQTRTK